MATNDLLQAYSLASSGTPAGAVGSIFLPILQRKQAQEQRQREIEDSERKQQQALEMERQKQTVRLPEGLRQTADNVLAEYNRRVLGVNNVNIVPISENVDARVASMIPTMASHISALEREGLKQDAQNARALEKQTIWQSTVNNTSTALNKIDADIAELENSIQPVKVKIAKIEEATRNPKTGFLGRPVKPPKLSAIDEEDLAAYNTRLAALKESRRRTIELRNQSLLKSGASQAEIDELMAAEAANAEIKNLTIPSGQQATVLSTADQQALDWALANPNDPRAKAIRQRLNR